MELSMIILDSIARDPVSRKATANRAVILRPACATLVPPAVCDELTRHRELQPFIYRQGLGQSDVGRRLGGRGFGCVRSMSSGDYPAPLASAKFRGASIYSTQGTVFGARQPVCRDSKHSEISHPNGHFSLHHYLKSLFTLTPGF
ncbi:unnamed protein product, partial [Iphiclides podalirius]